MVLQSQTVFSYSRNVSLTDDPLALFGRAAIGFLIIVAMGIWLLIARSVFIQEDDMEHPTRVGQLYGYTVCLIAVVLGIMTITSVVEKIITLASPGATLEGDYTRPSLTSFEAYRATQGRGGITFNPAPGSATTTKPDTIPVAELRSRYEALHTDRLLRERQDAVRSLAASAVGLILAIVLFVTHWRWLGQPLARGRVAAT